MQSWRSDIYWILHYWSIFGLLPAPLKAVHIANTYSAFRDRPIILYRPTRVKIVGQNRGQGVLPTVYTKCAHFSSCSDRGPTSILKLSGQTHQHINHIDMDSSTPFHSAKKKNNGSDGTTGGRLERPTLLLLRSSSPHIAWAVDPTGIPLADSEIRVILVMRPSN